MRYEMTAVRLATPNLKAKNSPIVQRLCSVGETMCLLDAMEQDTPLPKPARLTLAVPAQQGECCADSSTLSICPFNFFEPKDRDTHKIKRIMGNSNSKDPTRKAEHCFAACSALFKRS